MKSTEYGYRLRTERLRLQMTQQAFAEAVGVSKGSQVGYESGAHLPSIHYLVQAATIGVDTDFVLFGRLGEHTAIDKLNWQTATQILATINTCLKEDALTLPLEKKMRLMQLFLSKFSKAEAFKVEKVVEMLDLVA